MTSGPLTTNAIVITGFSIAFLHAMIPTHWLPFVLTARVQKWGKGKTLLITAFAGLGHVAITALLGFLIAWCGIELNEKIGSLFPWIAGGALFLFGSFFVIRQLQGKGHSHLNFFGGHHHHEHDHHVHGPDCDHGHDHGHEEEELPPHRSDWGAILSLLALLTFSPCEGFLPVYVAGARYGWPVFLLLTLTLSVATVICMVFFTTLTMMGMAKLKLSFVEKYENGVLGVLLMLLGGAVVIIEKSGG